MEPKFRLPHSRDNTVAMRGRFGLLLLCFRRLRIRTVYTVFPGSLHLPFSVWFLFSVPTSPRSFLRCSGWCSRLLLQRFCLRKEGFLFGRYILPEFVIRTQNAKNQISFSETRNAGGIVVIPLEDANTRQASQNQQAV